VHRVTAGVRLQLREDEQMRLLRAAVTIAAITMIWSAGAKAATATVHTWGYLPTRDGTLLRYDLLRPAALANQRIPVLLNYEGYAAGTDATDNGLSTYSDRLMARGYALLGVSVRGTGCSQGKFDPFDHTMGEDGYDAVEWAARQPWSDGKVGMIGVSFGGITQLLTAGQQPPHLRAIAASSATSDLYRDVAYPGGILEYDFTFAWTGIQKEGGTTSLASVAAAEGDSQCMVKTMPSTRPPTTRSTSSEAGPRPSVYVGRELPLGDPQARERDPAHRGPGAAVQPMAGRAVAGADLGRLLPVPAPGPPVGQRQQRQPRTRLLQLPDRAGNARLPGPLRPRR
jgi:pimeloyl-ACP methyl ester carboxylesterase